MSLLTDLLLAGVAGCFDGCQMIIIYLFTFVLVVIQRKILKVFDGLFSLEIYSVYSGCSYL